MHKYLYSLLLLAGALETGACYDTPRPSCAFLCGEGSACPEDYQCSAEDNRCHLVLAGGALAVCERPLGEDAARPDAPVDGGIDGSIDAGPADASIDVMLPVTTHQATLSITEISVQDHPELGSGGRIAIE